MNHYTINSIKNITTNDIDEKFETLDVSEKNQGKVSEVRENIKKLIEKNTVFPNALNMINLTNLCNRQSYHDFLKRRDVFLQEHQVMDANEFAKLFGNKDLQNKEITKDKELVSGKYNKENINQGKLGICVFDTFLKQLKETPMFETLIRCSLQRNDENNGRKCLIPFCNTEGKYEEITDEDINYLKTSKIGPKELISDTSLGFNILETLLIKMIGNKDKYPTLASGKNFGIQSKIYDNLKTISPDDLLNTTYGIIVKPMRDTFLGKDVIESTGISDYNDEDLERLINLTKTGIIKLTTTVDDDKFRNNYFRKIINNIKTPEVYGPDTNSNEKTLNERGYTHKILHEAGPDEDISIGKAQGFANTFKIKGSKEWFGSGHAYSIEGMHKENGETFITIINPRYTGEKINIPLKYMKELFSVQIYGINIDKLFIPNE